VEQGTQEIREFGARVLSVLARRAPDTRSVARGRKPHIFVAMPFAGDLGDLFHYGISRAISDAGYLCERVDAAPSVGDVLARIKERIRTAAFVVAELTGGNPNVYLEVGYAWGRGVPTILVVREAEVGGLYFDIRGQRCVTYTSIRDLEEKLCRELAALKDHAAGLRG
jgi:hypothetical protein